MVWKSVGKRENKNKGRWQSFKGLLRIRHRASGGDPPAERESVTSTVDPKDVDDCFEQRMRRRRQKLEEEAAAARAKQAPRTQIPRAPRPPWLPTISDPDAILPASPRAQPLAPNRQMPTSHPPPIKGFITTNRIPSGPEAHVDTRRVIASGANVPETLVNGTPQNQDIENQVERQSTDTEFHLPPAARMDSLSPQSSTSSPPPRYPEGRLQRRAKSLPSIRDPWLAVDSELEFNSLVAG